MFYKSTLSNQIIYLVLMITLFACTDQVSEKAATALSRNESKNWPAYFGFGQPATEKKIAELDIDVRPDGKGLPPGSGTVQEGRIVYMSKCAVCHGNSGVDGPYNRLVSSDTSKAKTIGNYWPYATTIFDYIKRAMPFSSPGSLTDGEVYSITAYLLHENKLIDSNAIINAQTLPEIEMPAKKLFVQDDRKGGAEIR